MRRKAGESNSSNVDVGLHQGSVILVLTERATKEVIQYMMFVDDIVHCGGKEVDKTGYLNTWRKSLQERFQIPRDKYRR